MNNIYYDSDSYNFGLSSRNFEEKLNKKQKNIDEFLAVTQDVLRDDEYKYQDPITGKLIINASQANIWVSNHVYFMFSIGSIYDKHDFNNLSALLENFDREKEIYLGTIFDTYSYNVIKFHIRIFILQVCCLSWQRRHFEKMIIISN